MVPVATGVTSPLVLLIVALDVALLVHVPPATPSVKIVVPPMHTVVVSDIGEGDALTVYVTDALQPPASV